MGVPNAQPSEIKTFIDYSGAFPENRLFKDAENKILRQMDSDIYTFLKKEGISLDNIKLDLQLETTFNPFVMCKREILARQKSMAVFLKLLLLKV